MATAVAETQDTALEEPTIDPEANEKAKGIITMNVAIASAIGMVPIPLFDIAALLTQQLLMIKKLGNLYGQKFSEDLGRKALVSLIGATLPSTSFKYAAFSLLKSIPIVGSTAALLTMPILSGSLTYAVGKVFNFHFATGGSYLSFDPKRYQAMLRKEMQVGTRVARETRPQSPP